MFGWPAVPSYDLPGGGPAYPLSAPAVRFRWRPVEPVNILVGVFNGSPTKVNGGDSQKVNASGTQLPTNGGVLSFVELQYAYPALGSMELPGAGAPLGRTYKIGAWYDSERFDDERLDAQGTPLASPASSGTAARHRGSYSVYAVADQMLWRQARDPNRSLSAFTRVMAAPQADRNFLTFSANLGLTYHDPPRQPTGRHLRPGHGLRKGEPARGAGGGKRRGCRPASRSHRLRAGAPQRDVRGGHLPIPVAALLAGLARPTICVRPRRRRRRSGPTRHPSKERARPRNAHQCPILTASGARPAACATALAVLAAPAAANAATKGYLETIHHHTTLTSSVTDNGDLNPYAVFVAPVSAGKIQKDDVLVDNFNNLSNLQGTGTTIVLYRSSTKQTLPFARLPQSLKACPGGVGLTTSMAMLKTGWVIVGSTPSRDGTTATKGDGCLIVLDSMGTPVRVWSGAHIVDPWGNMAVKDEGAQATLFISMAGEGLPSPDVLDPRIKLPVVVKKASVLRLRLTAADGQPPEIVDETVVGDGFAQRADRDNFLLGPTGEALGADGTLYVTDGLDNVITAIPNALTRTDSAGVGREVTKDGLLSWPLALCWTPEGHLLAANGKDGRVVEIDPVAGKQIYAQWIDSDQAQSPPGNGDLFGLAMLPDNSGFYYVEDDVNTLMRASR